ncbi:MAG: glycosyltransferase family 2 protein [Phycisphaerales bacterium]
MPLPLSIATVCKDSGATIGRMLDSVAGLGSEVVAVDSGSADGTIGVLERAGAAVIRSPWLGHIATKQKALEACTQPWVLALDSDESLTPELRRSIEGALRADDPAIGGYTINRKVYYRGRPLNFAWQPEPRLRLIRRTRAAWTGLDPHDRLELLPTVALGRGTVIGRLAGDLRHDSIASFADFLAKQASHARAMARSLHAAGERGSVVKLVTSPAGALLKQLIIKQAWRDGWPGWLAAGSTAAATLMKHICLVELSRAGADPAPGAPTEAPSPNGGPSGALRPPP